MTNGRSRTEEWRSRGARDLSGGGGISAPFVRWPDDNSYCWCEGRVVSVWEGKYGQVATLELTAASRNLVAVEGAGDDRQQVRVGPGERLNVGLNYTALDGIGPEQESRLVHVACTGWAESKSGDRYRTFEVLEAPEVGAGEPRPGPSGGREPDPSLEPRQEAGPRHLDGEDDLPF